MMKTYEVELRRTSYIVVTVEADTQEEAEAKAYDEGAVKLDNYASWDVESIEEIKREAD
jgi:hypothetical protein